MITRFRLENFKAHRHTDLALHQFTVLVGDNGSGKTSVLEALRFPDALGQMLARQFERELVELVRHGTDQLKLSWEGRARDQRPWAVAVEVNVSEGKVRGRRARLGPLKLVAFCEAPGDFRLVSGLVDRVLREGGPPGWSTTSIRPASCSAGTPMVWATIS
jgi:recombinational DNA repair ATPase RecF